VCDIVRRTPTFPNSTLEDFALLRGDGSALFLLANVVDDADSRISHVIRGEDHLGNTAKYVQLWEALGYGPVPTFAHLPLLVKLNEDGTKPKLSKRRDRVAVEDFRDLGFLPNGFVHYLASLGFTSADDGIFNLDAFAANLKLEAILPSPAVFDEVKLRDVNGAHIRALDPGTYLGLVTEYAGNTVLDGLGELILVTQTRVETLAETLDMLRFALPGDVVIDQESWAAVLADTALAEQVLAAATLAYSSCAWDTTSLHETTNEFVAGLGLKLRKAQLPIRVAITGQRIGPPLFEALSVLGRKRTLARLGAAQARL
jgi:glutamyl-tRNA synthetase